MLPTSDARRPAEDLHTLLVQLRRLLDSCADHDIFTDALISPAAPEAYLAALDGIRECSAGIRDSGISKDHLSSLLSELEQHDPVSREVILPPGDLLPLIRPVFTASQEELAWEACHGWGCALEPSDPDAAAGRIRAVLAPLSLADLLAPGVTRMQRFPAALAMERHGARGPLPIPGEIPSFEAAGRILVIPTKDPARFLGQLHPAIFRFLSGQGILPSPLFQGLFLQVLGDIGIVRGGGPAALDRILPEQIASAGALFHAGESLLRNSGFPRDVRELFRATLRVTGSGIGCDDLERLSGHVLAGVIASSPDEDRLSLSLEFLRDAAGNPWGRPEPRSGQARDLDLAMQEHAQLVRAITGDYRWRSAPYPPPAGTFRPPVDLWPDNCLILYEPGDLAYRSPDATGALVMEALYCSWFRPDVTTCDPVGDPWYPRLARVLSLSRAARLGSAVHPGVRRWFERYCSEEYDPIGRCADRTRIGQLPLPGQFLEGALFEARTGVPAAHIRDEGVKYALAITADARRELGTAPDGEWDHILKGRVWPVFEAICLKGTVHGSAGAGQPAGAPKGKELPFTPRGRMDREDAAIQVPVQPSAPFTGRSLAGDDGGLAEDGGLSLPTGSPGAAVQATEGKTDRRQVPGSGGSQAPSRPGSSPGAGVSPSGISATAGSLMDACTRSREVLDTLASSLARGGRDHPDDPADAASALHSLSRKIDSLAAALPQQVEALREAAAREEGGAGTPDPRREELDGLLRVSERVREVAKDYSDAARDLAHKVRDPGAGHEPAGQIAAMTREILRELQAAGAEFQRLAGASSVFREDTALPAVHLPGEPNEPGTGKGSRAQGRLDPAFVSDTGYSPEIWEHFSYFDATFDESTGDGSRGDYSGRSQRDTAGPDSGRAEQVLTREAEEYLATLKQRTRSDWETMDEKAERIRRIALFESHAVGGDDYATYQRFYQPVAGLIIVARKNIQQALQKSRANRDENELISGDDIDEENLAAVRTTMRIFRDRGREPDRTRWCLSLLIDASSSMHDETIAKKLQAAIQAAILFGEAVNHLRGIRFEIAAFSDTEYIPLKRYQDDWNVHQGCYLIREVVRANGGTNDVGAVSSALDRMNRLPMAAGANRMIFVISDGQSGVGGRDQMRAIVRTNRETRIFGWGIGPDMEKIEETYLPYGTWVPDIADLPRSIGEVLRRELGRPANAGWKEREADLQGEGSCTT